MIRSVHLTPAITDWIAYQIDEQQDDGSWIAVAARSRTPDTPAGAFDTAANFSGTATVFRVVWVGDGGSKNMQIGAAQALEDAQAPRIVGGLRVA